ncbi:hypothetical protein JW977_02055 [Candidatus Falkowbacteria bacterium]|nr:hypothetical protein [Candidatus Falkowbacteria bacterium]
MSYRDTASFGKRQEYSVVAELLKRGFDVYMTLVDDQGIDCVIRLSDKKYIDVQIKARSKTAKHGNFFAAMTVNPRNNFFWIFYTEYDNNLWIIPSKELVKLCQINKSGENVGKMHLLLPKSDKGLKAIKYNKYKNENGFKLLKRY